MYTPSNEHTRRVREQNPLFGFRCWDTKDDKLLSIFTDYIWTPGTNITSHLGVKTPGVSISPHWPFAQCICGFFAANIDEVAAYADARRVYGVVAGWGTVQVTESKGWRATRAKPVAIFDVDKVHTFDDHVLQAISHRYDIPILRPDSLHADDYKEYMY